MRLVQAGVPVALERSLWQREIGGQPAARA